MLIDFVQRRAARTTSRRPARIVPGAPDPLLILAGEAELDAAVELLRGRIQRELARSDAARRGSLAADRNAAVAAMPQGA
jgi:hypothetical protein